MSKKDKIKFFKQQLASSREMMGLAMQNYNLAARLESEANSALHELGAPEGQGRKVKYSLSENEKLSLISNLTVNNGKRN